jgi:hypothetical protein
MIVKTPGVMILKSDTVPFRPALALGKLEIGSACHLKPDVRDSVAGTFNCHFQPACPVPFRPALALGKLEIGSACHLKPTLNPLAGGEQGIGFGARFSTGGDESYGNLWATRDLEVFWRRVKRL